MDDFDDIQCEDYYGEEPEWDTYYLQEYKGIEITKSPWPPLYRIVCSNTTYSLKESKE
tara:strand:- start:470 stop:643 length:174 start_codon:yes stop_codon:yes gene_type:complete